VTGGTAASLAGFAVLLIAGAALQVTARRAHRAGVARVVGGAMHTTPGRVTVLVIWVWLGVHFLAR
jgi:hypothetical protein